MRLRHVSDAVLTGRNLSTKELKSSKHAHCPHELMRIDGVVPRAIVELVTGTCFRYQAEHPESAVSSRHLRSNRGESWAEKGDIVDTLHGNLAISAEMRVLFFFSGFMAAATSTAALGDLDIPDSELHYVPSHPEVLGQKWFL